MDMLERGSKVDKIIILVSLVIFLVSIFLIFDDRYIFPQRGASARYEPIATVLSTENDVRRRFPGDIVWVPVHADDELHENEMLFTGENSWATVMLDDGSEVKVAPRGLVLFQKGDFGKKGANILVKQGSLSGTLKESASLQFETGGKQQKVKASDGKSASFGINLSKGAELEITSGEAEVHRGKQSEKLKKNQIAKLDSEKIKRESIGITLILPKMNEVISVKEFPAEVNLTWVFMDPKTGDNVDKFIVEISEDQSFKFIRNTISTKNPYLIIRDLKKEGTIYWKVKGQNSGEAIMCSQTGVFSVKLAK